VTAGIENLNLQPELPPLRYLVVAACLDG
jgi:hypothetical protein